MSSQIMLPCLGRPFNLGMLYDSHSEKLIPGKTLWDSKVLKSAMRTTKQQSSNFEIYAEDSLHTKSSSLDINASLKLSFLGGMVSVSGAAKFLNDKKSSEQQARVTLKYTTTSRFEQLTMEQLGAIQYPEVLDDHHATHVVTGVTYGSDAFFVFDRSVSKSEEVRNVHGEMEAKIKFIPVEGSGSVDISEADKSETDRFHCKFYGDIILPSNPSTFVDAVKVYRELPQLLNNGDGDQSVAKSVYLYPLSELDGKHQQIVRSISYTLVAQVEEIMQSFCDMEMRAKDLKNHDICYKFVNSSGEISSLLSLINQFKMGFMKELSVLLPKIRSSGVEEKELAELISSIRESPFSSRAMAKYLQGKDKEIKQLAQYLKNMSKQPKIRFDFTNTDCDLVTLTIDDEIERVVCFAFNLNSEASSYVKSLEHYMKTKEVLPVESTGWTSDVSKSLRSKSKAFIDFATANSRSESTVFVVTEHNEDVDTSGPAIILYTNGEPVEFEPPGKPSKPQASSAAETSVDLTWTKPKLGSEGVISYTVLYQSVAETEPRRSTGNTGTSVRIEGLSPDLEYQFRVQAVSEAGVSVDSDSCSVQTKGTARLADEILKKSELIKSGKPSVYRPPATSVDVTSETACKYVIGTPESSHPPKPEKVLWLLGAVGAGKSTLIDGFANYLFGVNWKDHFRFKVTKGKGSRHTKRITVYSFHCTNLPYMLTLVDSPGFDLDADPKSARACSPPGYKYFGNPMFGHLIPNKGRGVDITVPNKGRGVVPNKGRGVVPNKGRGVDIIVPNKGRGVDITVPNKGRGVGSVMYSEVCATPKKGRESDDSDDSDDSDVPDFDEQYKEFLSGKCGVDHLDAFCLVSPAPYPELTVKQRGFLKTSLSINYFGENLFLLSTFSDITESQKLAVSSYSHIPSSHCFSFNNSALYYHTPSDSDDFGGDEDLGSSFWDMMRLCFKYFFLKLPDTSSLSLPYVDPLSSPGRI